MSDRAKNIDDATGKLCHLKKHRQDRETTPSLQTIYDIAANLRRLVKDLSPTERATIVKLAGKSRPLDQLDAAEVEVILKPNPYNKFLIDLLEHRGPYPWVECPELDRPNWIDLYVEAKQFLDDHVDAAGAVYIDTEGLYTNLSRPRGTCGAAVALLIVYNAQQSVLLLWRTHRYTVRQMEAVQDCVRRLCSRRRLVVFSREEFVEEVAAVDDLQIRLGGGNLKKLANDVGIVLAKAETMSNWGVDSLTRGQVVYAAMDVIALAHLDH